MAEAPSRLQGAEAPGEAPEGTFAEKRLDDLGHIGLMGGEEMFAL